MSDEKKWSLITINKTTTSSAIYGMGFVGAAIYYISEATTFWVGVFGVIKAIVWPAFLVFHMFQHVI
ncbi:hypothetical protein ACFL04_02445 [Patescibacteria group bacterium]